MSPDPSKNGESDQDDSFDEFLDADLNPDSTADVSDPEVVKPRDPNATYANVDATFSEDDFSQPDNRKTEDVDLTDLEPSTDSEESESVDRTMIGSTFREDDSIPPASVAGESEDKIQSDESSEANDLHEAEQVPNDGNDVSQPTEATVSTTIREVFRGKSERDLLDPDSNSVDATSVDATSVESNSGVQDSDDAPLHSTELTVESRPSQNPDSERDRDLNDDLTHLTEKTLATGASHSPQSKQDRESDDDLSHLTGMTLATGQSKPSEAKPTNTTIPDIRSHLTERTGDFKSQSELDKTIRGKKTARQHDQTLGGSPGTEADRADDEIRRRRAKGKKKGMPPQIGRYEVKRLLGEGTFGKVYEARDPQLNRLVAIKVAKSISGRTQIRRFLREARAAAQLRHPNIIPVYEYGQVDGENIIVYEFVEGETLKAYLRRLKIPPLEDTLRIVSEIADGLNYAHEQGIIHRDMKPENVLIDPAGRPHIADFGCARSIEDETHLTIDGSILGTPMYMSPEQASGKANVADGRTDIWSVGVILYEMVSGKRPFHGQLSDLLFWICNNDPAPLRKLKPDAPADIETICSKCLTREIDKRFETAGILVDELARYERGEPIVSRRVGTLQRTWMWAKRNQAVASLMATVAVTLLIGSIVSSAFAVKAYSEQKARALAQMNALTTAEASALPGIFSALLPFRETVLPQLKAKLNTALDDPGQRHRLHMAIIELEEDQAARVRLADTMVEDLLAADPGDFFVCRECLRFRKNELSARLWAAATDLSESSSSGRRFRAAAALALYDPDSPNWENVSPDVAGYLTSVNEIEMSHWLPSVKPIRKSLKPILVTAYLNQASRLDSTPQRAAAILSRLFTDDVEFLVGLVPDATPLQVPYLSGAFEINRSDSIAQLQSRLESLDGATASSRTPIATQKANIVTTLIQLAEESHWNYLGGGRDMSVATELIERLGPATTPFERLEFMIRKWESLDPNVLSGLLLALGQYKENQILGAQKNNLQSTLMDVFSKHPDSRVHSSARWLLTKWNFQKDVERCEKQLRRPEPDPDLNWHIDPVGNTFALFGPIASAEIGLNKSARDYWSDSSNDETTGFDASDVLNEPSHRKQIPRRFGICIHEVSVGQFRSFQEYVIANYEARIDKVDQEIEDLKSAIASDAKTRDEDEQNQDAPQQEKLNQLLKTKKALGIRIGDPRRKLKRRAEFDDQLPVVDVDFFTALAYCRWLSEQQNTECGLPSVKKLQEIYADGTDVLLTQDHLGKHGYRLPTAAEWEFACRGGTETLFPFGQTPASADQYAWYATNSDFKLQKTGQLKPGNTGLFDVLGNVSEWCLDWYREDLPKMESGAAPEIFVDFGPEFESFRSLDREFRGGAFNHALFDIRPTKRFSTRSIKGLDHLGFRLARTYETNPAPPAAKQ